MDRPPSLNGLKSFAGRGQLTLATGASGFLLVSSTGGACGLAGGMLGLEGRTGGPGLVGGTRFCAVTLTSTSA